jgi:hypothetical protein
MEFGPYQMQIFASLVVILGAAFVALICDLLKGNNEQLRELAIELRVRREEEHKRFQMLAPQVLAEATAGAPASALNEPSKPALAEKTAVAEKTAEAAGRKPKRPRDPHKRSLSADALAAIQLGEQLAASPKGRQAVSTPPLPAQPEEALVQPEIVTPVTMAEPAFSPEARSRDWSQLLSVRRPAPVSMKESRKAQHAAGLLDAVMAATHSAVSSASAEPALPAGFQDGFVLTRLVESRQPVSGLVVSVGATSLQSEDASTLANVRKLIQSLLGSNDFAAQSGNDEFLLIYPGERGAQAQRKLSQIAEQLWDFQLRSMGTMSIQFSWGGVEVRSETIDEAIASATERMQETRRGRKILTMEARPEAEAPLRQAV